MNIKFVSKNVVFIGVLFSIIFAVSIFYVSTFHHSVNKFVYFDDGNIYMSSLRSSPTKLASNVNRILDYNEVSHSVLYLSLSAEAGVGGRLQGSDLILTNPDTGKNNVIAKKIVTAKLFPDGSKVVVQNEEYEISILSLDGKESTQIGKHGSNPIVSHDGKFVVYKKLADEGDGIHLYESSPYGLSLYNISTKEEEEVTDDKDDFLPLGFSADTSKLYFNSGRKYDTSLEGFENHVASLWMVDINTKQVTRLTNIDEKEVQMGNMVPTIDTSALWSLDRTVVISSTGSDSGVWKFVFNKNGILEKAERIADGDSPRWLVQDESVAVLAEQKGKLKWESVNLK